MNIKNLVFSFLLSTGYLSAFVVLLFLLFAVLKNRISPQIRYLIWILMAIGFVFPLRPRFGQGLIPLYTSAQPSTKTTVQSVVTAVSQTSTNTANSNLWERFLSSPWFEIFIAIWLIGLLFSIGKYIYSYIRFRKMLRRWGETVTDETILSTFSRVKQELKIKKATAVLHYPMTHSPMLSGFQRIFVILPELDYTEEELELIFRHELTHYRHHDIYINLLIIIVKSLHWFNPLAHLACKETQEMGEMYCDYAVLHHSDTSYRSFYGETILTMIDRSQKSPMALTTCFYSNKFNLKRRIIGIMEQRLPQRFLSTATLVFVTIVLLFSNSIFALETGTAQKLSTSDQTVATKLSQKDAIATALKDADLSDTTVTDLQTTEEKGQYKILFSHNQIAHEYLINAKNGNILRSKHTQVVEKTVIVEQEAPPATTNQTVEQPTAPSTSTGNTTQVATNSGIRPSSDDDEDDYDEDDNDDEDDD